MAIEFKLELNSNVERITKDAIEKALGVGAIIVESNAKALAPVDTEFLLNNIFREVTAEEAIIYDTVEYAPYQEFGTAKMQAQPFLRPAAYNNREKILKAMSLVMKGKL